MGIYDRDYYREQDRGFSLRKPRTVVGALIAINVAIYVLAAIVAQDAVPYNRLLHPFAVQVGTLTQPLAWWKFLTYGFLHDWSPMHVIFNMLGLWFLGRDVEARYGSKEFLWVYLAMIVAGGVVWAAVENLKGPFPGQSPLAFANQPAVGASAAVAGVVVLYACNFPHRTLLLFGIIPMPAWFLGVIAVGYDVMGSIGHVPKEMGGIAYTAHIGGAALAVLYFAFGWQFTRWFDFRRWRLKSAPWLRVHVPRDESEPEAPHNAGGREEKVEQQVDQILEKIHRLGESSLTRHERKILESASREYQRRRHDDRP